MTGDDMGRLFEAYFAVLKAPKNGEYRALYAQALESAAELPFAQREYEIASRLLPSRTDISEKAKSLPRLPDQF
jgi:hypothetical protein